MRIILLIILLLRVAPSCMAADFNPFDGPKPIAILIQSNPWAMVIGSDTPRVAIYENGEVIFPKKDNERLVYHHVTLESGTLAKLQSEWNPVLAIEDLRRVYNMAPNITDQ